MNFISYNKAFFENLAFGFHRVVLFWASTWCISCQKPIRCKAYCVSHQEIISFDVWYHILYTCKCWNHFYAPNECLKKECLIQVTCTSVYVCLRNRVRTIWVFFAETFKETYREMEFFCYQRFQTILFKWKCRCLRPFL